MKRIALLVAATVIGLPLLIILIGGIYQLASATLDRSTYPMAGDLVEIDGIRLHLHCAGEEHRGPTIILLTGMGSLSSAWTPVMNDLATTHHVCTYDRDGTGWSEDSGMPRDAVLASARLHQLAAKTGMRAPYVLAGHSYGGVVAQIFADTYPAETAGVVLVDSAHKDMGQRFPPQAQEEFANLLASFGMVETLHYTGLPRAFGLMAPSVDGLEGRALAASMSRLNTVQHMRGSAAEADGWETSAARARQITSLGKMPLHVIVASDWPDFMLPSWLEMQGELAALSANGRFEIVEGANHSQIAMDRRYAPRVSAAIRRVAAQAGGSN
ncbi:MAG: alpha/beta fold hydrolase [Candidatus Phaeomarinobacter sp.]